MKRYSSLLNHRENEVLSYLEDDEIVIFTAKELFRHFKEHYKYGEICETLAKLNHIGHIERFEKGKYVKRGFKDQYVIGNHITNDAVIAYWSALNIHGLTEQFANTVFVQTTRKKQNKRIFNVDYKFIKVKPEKITGIISLGYGNHTFRITDKEKTIVDCFDLPEYAGDFQWIMEIFINNRWKQDLLIKYCNAVGNDATVKRMGYLAEFHKTPLTRFIRFAKGKVNNTINLLNPLASNTGSIITKWGLKINN